VPGYKLYSWIFGVNLTEMDPEDLTQYRSLSEFFMRQLKQGVRPIADNQLVSPADGRVVNFGYIENKRVEQVKGVSYSLDALLSGSGPGPTAQDSITSNPTGPPKDEAKGASSEEDNATVDEREFAKLNGISYSIDQLMGNEPHENQDPETTKPKKAGWKRLFNWRRSSSSATSSQNSTESDSVTPHTSQSQEHDVSVPASASSQANPVTEHSFGEQLSLASQTFDPLSPHWSLRGVPKEGNKMYFCVVYLAPGDYHRFHSPTSWVVERRRHFAGELFSVSPYMTKLLSDLFVLNERVALLGRWRHGFFSMVPVGATNVGSIRIDFDSELRTNSPSKPKTPGEYVEATYAKSSTLLGGKPLMAGEQMGGFWLVSRAQGFSSFSCIY
jgi:phosphatidylserine decarboxylase